MGLRNIRQKNYMMDLSTEELQKTVQKKLKNLSERDGFDLQENYLDRLISDVSTKFGIKKKTKLKLSPPMR